MIEIEKMGPHAFQVTISEGSSRTTHDVTVAPEVLRRLTGGAGGAERLVEASFGFLLEREPKESILRRFDLQVIGRYFPEYEEEMRRLFSRGESFPSR